MSTRNDYSSEEWKAISGAPVAAGLFIVLADASGPVGISKEAHAVRNAITDAARGDAPEIIKALAENPRVEIHTYPGCRGALSRQGIARALEFFNRHL